MDDTAQNAQVNPTVTPQPSVPVSPSVSPVLPVPTPGSSVSPQPPVAQIPGFPTPTRKLEQGPVGGSLPPREAAPVDDAEAVTTATDDSAAQPDDAANAADAQPTEAVDGAVQESQPQVEIAKELQEAGVEKGEDATPEQLPEEQLAKPDATAAQSSSEDLRPDTQATASGVSLSSTPVQLEEVKKKNGIHNSIKWLATELIRHLKKMAIKPEDQKTTW